MPSPRWASSCIMEYDAWAIVRRVAMSYCGSCTECSLRLSENNSFAKKSPLLLIMLWEFKFSRLTRLPCVRVVALLAEKHPAEKKAEARRFLRLIRTQVSLSFLTWLSSELKTYNLVSPNIVVDRVSMWSVSVLYLSDFLWMTQKKQSLRVKKSLTYMPVSTCTNAHY